MKILLMSWSIAKGRDVYGGVMYVWRRGCRQVNARAESRLRERGQLDATAMSAAIIQQHQQSTIPQTKSRSILESALSNACRTSVRRSAPQGRS